MASRKTLNDTDILWREYFSDPSQWLITCRIKTGTRASEFMHKLSRECLWVDSFDNSTWVSQELCRRGFIISGLGQEKCIPGACDEEAAIAYVALLKTCAKKKDLGKGVEIHNDITEKGLIKTNPYIQSALVSMYAKCGALGKAFKVLKEQPVRNVATWNALIAGYAQQGQITDAFDRLEQMKEDGITPNAITFTSILRACSNTREIEKGIQIHADILKMELLENDVLLGTALVDMYAKCGHLEKAQEVFDELLSRDVVTWNALIGGYAHHAQSQSALSCFEQMENEGFSPNAITFTCVLKACGNIGEIDTGIEIHHKMFDQGLSGKDTILGTALVDMYAKCGKLTRAHQMFDELLVRDVAAWNALITGYAQHGQAENALTCFDQMNSESISPNMTTIACILEACGKIAALDKGTQIHDEFIQEGTLKKDVVLGTAVVDMYAKCGNLIKAQHIHDSLHVRDIVSWNALIAGYAQRGHGEDALNCLCRMQHEGFTPNGITFVCILNACGSTGAIDKGIQIHNEIVNKGVFDRTETVLGTALIGMYMKCGDLGKAQEVFDQLILRDVASWNALILGYAQQGHSEKALLCFQKMQNQNLCPDIVSFLCVLNACCHSGLVEDGRMYFAEMSEKYNIEPEIEHYTCMVDLFCRSGHFLEAMAMLKKAPFSDYPIWLVLLTACGKCGNVEIGSLAFHEAVQLDSSNGAAYTCMINIYIGVSMYDEAEKVEAMRVENTGSGI